jgi:hypothetical protein
MIYIAHRGLYQGPNTDKENHPDQISEALKKGYHVEVDVRVVNKKLFLGHDEPTYQVKENFFQDRRFWIHCKNIEALYFFTTNNNFNYNYFWHENDQYTLTSKKYIWTYPGKDLTDVSIMVMPEYVDVTLENTKNVTCYGICSDYVEKIKELINEAYSNRR